MTKEKDNDLGCPKEGYDYWDDYKNFLRQLKAGMKNDHPKE